MHRYILLAALLASPALSHDAPANQVSEARLRADVARLVSFGTRHTLSVQDDPRRGIGAARRWAEAELRKTAKACGGCLQIVRPETMAQGERVPKPTRLVDVVAIQRGTERPNEVVIVQGHIDSRVTDPMNASSDAPGANDDGSGTALVLEAARVLSKRKYPATIVYAKAQGWTVKAVLNNDIVGGSRGSDGLIDDSHVRVFSEGPRADADDKIRAAARRFGGENDSPSRNLSRFVAGLDGPALEVREVWRADRMGRGGDHLPFLEAGYPAIRFSVAIEDYEHQHQDLRTENGIKFGDTIDEMDFAYLARVAALNIKALDALARAPMPPIATAEAAVQTFTKVCWQASPGAASYNVWRRRTDAAGWEETPLGTLEIPPDQRTFDPTPHPQPNGTTVRIVGQSFCREFPGVRGDDWIFGVSGRAADGAESPISAAVPGGGFAPLPQ